jgi:hypothetical protein
LISLCLAGLLLPSFFSLKHSVKEAVNLRTRSGLYSASIVRAHPYPTTSKPKAGTYRSDGYLMISILFYCGVIRESRGRM